MRWSWTLLLGPFGITVAKFLNIGVTHWVVDSTLLFVNKAFSLKKIWSRGWHFSPSLPDRGLTSIWNIAHSVSDARAEISGILVMVRHSSTTSRGTSYWDPLFHFTLFQVFRLRMRVFFELQSLLVRERKGLISVSTQLFFTVAGKGTMSRSCKFITSAMSRCGEFEGAAQKIWKTNKNTHAAVLNA